MRASMYDICLAYIIFTTAGRIRSLEQSAESGKTLAPIPIHTHTHTHTLKIKVRVKAGDKHFGKLFPLLSLHLREMLELLGL